VVDVGVSKIMGSGALKLEVNIKNVTKRKAKSTIGVISKAGVERGIFTLGMFYVLIRYVWVNKSKRQLSR
jgi:hypothetical protein